jgi:hypothetical protein
MWRGAAVPRDGLEGHSQIAPPNRANSPIARSTAFGPRAQSTRRGRGEAAPRYVGFVRRPPSVGEGPVPSRGFISRPRRQGQTVCRTTAGAQRWRPYGRTGARRGRASTPRQQPVRCAAGRADRHLPLHRYARSNDQRPTTNDQRPTTNDQRPTTNDRGYRPKVMSGSIGRRVLSVRATSGAAPCD